MKVKKALMGSTAFFITYRALAHSRLDPGTWHGYQELFLKKPPEIKNVSFDFKLSDSSYFTFYFARHSDTLSGLRLSNDPQHISAYLKISDYRFVKKEKFNTPNLEKGWNNCKFIFLPDHAEIYFNGILSGQIENKGLYGNILGFRGCSRSTLIDNVSVNTFNKKSFFYENFSKKYYHIGALILLFLLFNLLYLALPKRQKLMTAIMINPAVAIGFICIYFLVSGQEKYPERWMINWHGFSNEIENSEVVNHKILAAYSPAVQKKNIKILLIGSSQTWGSGAGTEAATFSCRFEKLLKNYFACDGISCINAGISSINSTDLLSYYKHDWIKMAPDICIINLSYNDGGSKKFRENLHEFILLNNLHQIKTVLVSEPAAVANDGLIVNHAIVREMAEKYKLKHIDMPHFLAKHNDDGFIWWDFIHLTDYGQKLFAEKLFTELKDMVGEKMKTSRQYQ